MSLVYNGFKLGFNLSDRNIEQYLSDLEKYINILIESQSEGVQPLKTSVGTEGREAPKINNAPVFAE
jgi:hypothetical protein